MRYVLLLLLLLSIVAARQEQIPVHTMDGDPDRPVIVGSMSNALDAPIVIEGPKVRQHQQTDLDFLQRRASTKDELEAYAAALAQSDDSIKRILIDANRTDLFYKKTARLFGILPVRYTAQATASRGQVKVKFPWWLMFASHNGDDLKEAFEQMPSHKNDTVYDRQQTLQAMSSIMRHDTPKSSIQNMRG